MMPQIKPEHEVVDEFPVIAGKLVKKYPEVFSDLDIGRVKCVAIINKQRSERKKVWEVKAVPMPVRMDCPYAYYIIVYMDDWADRSKKHQALLVADALLSIPPADSEEGRLNSFDLKDFDIMIRTFGVDYLERDDVPDLLAANISWKHRN